MRYVELTPTTEATTEVTTQATTEKVNTIVIDNTKKVEDKGFFSKKNLKIMLIGMLFFSVILLIQSIWNLTHLKQDSPAAEKTASLNVLKDRGVQYALVAILLCVAYVMLFKTFGYVLVSFIVCLAIMILIGKRKWLQMILVSLLVPLCMWLLFYILLKVNIPMGPLTFLRDLVDAIL